MAAAGRIDAFRAWPPGFRALLALDRTLSEGPLEHSLLELVRLRASRENGCAFCSDLHERAASTAGVADARLAALTDWSGSAHFDARERAALALTDALARPAAGVPDGLLEDARKAFSSEELCQLVYVIATIHAWNRVAVADDTPFPGRKVRA